jgi:vibriolysin
MSGSKKSLCKMLVGTALGLTACATTGEPAGDQPDRSLQPVQVDGAEAVGPSTSLQQAAATFVNASAALTDLGDEWRGRDGDAAGASLVAAGVAAGAGHVRLQQYHDGVPVVGADVVAHSDGTRITSVAGNHVAGLAGINTKPSLLGAVALRLAKADHAKAANGSAAVRYERERTTLVILPQRDGQARLAWQVEFFTELQGPVAPGLWTYFIDALDGAILDKRNNLDTLSQASGPGGNPKVTRTWVNALDVEPSGALFAMNTAKLQTVNMNNLTSGGTIVTGPLTNIGDAPINDAHGFAEVTLNLLRNWGGYNSINNAGFVIKSRVHYALNYENAFWDGAQMTYGDGRTTFYPLSGDVDVVAHEIHHGFTSFHSNLIYSRQSGGMNESFSDIMGTAAEFYNEGLGADWDLGRDIFRGNTALRFMCDPRADGRSIDNLANYFDGLDVHFSSGIMNKAFCRAARRFATGNPLGNASVDSVRRAAKVFYEANDHYWTSSSTFVQGCEGTIDAAIALGYSAGDINALRASWADVGVNCRAGVICTPGVQTCDFGCGLVGGNSTDDCIVACNAAGTAWTLQENCGYAQNWPYSASCLNSQPAPVCQLN